MEQEEKNIASNEKSVQDNIDQDSVFDQETLETLAVWGISIGGIIAAGHYVLPIIKAAAGPVAEIAVPLVMVGVPVVCNTVCKLCEGNGDDMLCIPCALGVCHMAEHHH